MSNIGWYFCEANSPDGNYVDPFADSKFGMDKWSSFAREVIQNSIDAVDDESCPVEVTFDLNNQLTLEDIPGGVYLKDVISRCSLEAKNADTKSAYEVGKGILERKHISCLKISDRNTKGVKSGRDEAWGAFIFDEGKSMKQRPGSAGRHGVGKKVPFIISSVNTVLYSTKNKYIDEKIGEEISDCLFQGKSQLITWHDENGKKHYNKGWFGLIDNSAGIDNAVQPLTKEALSLVNDYFIRKDDYGTDVTIVGVNAEKIEEEIKKHIIMAVLNNFFVAILQGQLIVNVMGQIIDAANFDEIFARFYDTSEDKNVSLKDNLDVYYAGNSYNIVIQNSEKERIGSVDDFLGLNSEKKTKYYTIVRDHGMKICENRVNKSEQCFTALVYVRKEGQLNELLSRLENAAHDEFVIKDENMIIDQEAVYAYEQLKKSVREYICQNTKIEVGEEQDLEGLDNILEVPGRNMIIMKKDTGVPSLKKRVLKNGQGKLSKSKDDGEGDGVDEHGAGKSHNPPHKGGITPGGTIKGTIFSNFKSQPFFTYGNSGYVCKFMTNETLKKSNIIIASLNADGKADNTIWNVISEVQIDGKKCNCKNGIIIAGKITANKQHEMLVKVKNECIYKLVMELRDAEKPVKEVKNE